MGFDLFNGDADGIFALHQYRLQHPRLDNTLITGVKRDIRLLSQLGEVSNSEVTVFDVSLNSNRDSLVDILARHNSVTYFDHHFAGEIPKSEYLQQFIQTSANTCTSLIVNEQSSEPHSLWAICGAFGDNLHDAATTLGKTLNLTADQLQSLQQLGELVNYNGYGATVEDLHFHPAEIYTAVRPYSDPFEFIAQSEELQTLAEGYKTDLDLAMNHREENLPGNNRVYILPNNPWARRVSGVFSNFRARQQTAYAHAIITENSDQTLCVSVRAPLEDKRDADTLCNLFPTGGGRAAAAGINSLPADQLDLFLENFSLMYSK